MKCFLCVFLFAMLVPLCSGAEPLRITISAPPQLTDAEFFVWAIEQNNKTKAEWNKWYMNESKPRWINYGVDTAIDFVRNRRGSFFGSNIERGSVATRTRPNVT